MSFEPIHHRRPERMKQELLAGKKDESVFAFKELCLVTHPELSSLIMKKVLTPPLTAPH